MVWFAILRHAPAILSAAEALFQRAKTSRADDHTRSIEMRIDELAESSRALLKRPIKPSGRQTRIGIGRSRNPAGPSHG